MKETTKKKLPTKVKMVNTTGKKPKMKYNQVIKNFSRLGREVKISPKANTTIHEAGYKHEIFVESVSVVIGIGNDHIADLVMTVDAWKALKAGAEINVTTTKQFKELYG